jgi:hypothetical protein
LGSAFDEGADGSVCCLDSPWDLVYILRLDNGFEVIFQDLGKVVYDMSASACSMNVTSKHTLQFRTTKVFQNFLPVWWIVVTAQVWLKLAAQNLQGRALADTVCPHESKHLSWPWHGQPMQFEAVGGVSVGNLSLEIGRQIDDVDGIEGAFLWANTATNT